MGGGRGFPQTIEGSRLLFRRLKRSKGGAGGGAVFRKREGGAVGVSVNGALFNLGKLLSVFQGAEQGRLGLAGSLGGVIRV